MPSRDQQRSQFTKKMTAATPMIIINSSDWEDGWIVVSGVEKARISKSTQSGSQSTLAVCPECAGFILVEMSNFFQAVCKQNRKFALLNMSTAFHLENSKNDVEGESVMSHNRSGIVAPARA